MMAIRQYKLVKKFHSAPKLIFHRNDLLADRKRPAALILGFGGAKPKHIEKYAELYHKQGLGAISYTGIDFWDDLPDPSQGLPFAPLFLLPEHRERSLILHSTSMNGFRQLIRLYRYLDFQGEPIQRFRGILFDSCPTILTAEGLAYGRAVCGLDHSNSRGTRFLPQAIWTTAKFLFLKRTNENLLNEQQMYAYAGRWLIFPRNQAYIYSEEDTLVHYDDVEDFADRQKRKGNCVRLEKFSNSPHVQHIRSDPLRYQQIVNEIIKKSL